MPKTKWIIFSDDFGLRSPRHSETISAKKRYTLIPLCISHDSGLRSTLSFINHFSQKTVYLNTSMYFPRFRVEEHPFIQKPFTPKNGIP